jgi:hypothetical protein
LRRPWWKKFATPETDRVIPPKNASAIIEMTPELLSMYGMDMLPGPDPLRPEGAVLAAGSALDIQGTPRSTQACVACGSAGSPANGRHLQSPSPARHANRDP